MFDSKELRSLARDLTTKARTVGSQHEKIHLTQMARSYLLLSKNADWVKSTDKFLDVLKGGRQRWPYPAATAEPVELPSRLNASSHKSALSP